MLEPNGFFKIGMDELMQINKSIDQLSKNPEVQRTKTLLESTIVQAKKEVETHRQKMRNEKAARKSRRLIGEIEMTGDAFRRVRKRTVEREFDVQTSIERYSRIVGMRKLEKSAVRLQKACR